MIEGLVLGEETTRAVWRVGELGAMDEVIQRGTSSTSTTRGGPMREVKVPLAVVTVALKDEGQKKKRQNAYCTLALLTCLKSFLFKVVT